MKKKFIHDISASSFQVIINQCCGLLIFYILSAFLSKSTFGEINWTLAVLLTSFNILSLGMDQVVVKRIASENNGVQAFSLYATHTIIAGIIFYGILLLAGFIFDGFFIQYQLLLLLGIGKLMIFFSSPFKQLATGLEKYRALVLMSTGSNITRSMALLIFALLHQLNITIIIIVFVAGDLAELVLCYYIAHRTLKSPLQIRWNKTGYVQLIKESLPQSGVAIFTSTLARFDWILLGLLAGNIILAEYSFAYKAFEMASIPLLVIAPILITRFTKIFHNQLPEQQIGKLNDLWVLLRIEMIIASLTAMILCICWVPLIDWITVGRYGYVNRYTISILAATMPLLYLNNFLWTVNFAKGALSMIFRVILLTVLANILADIILIPHFKGEGAATGYLLAMIIQSVLYIRKTSLQSIPVNWQACLIIPGCALPSVLMASVLVQQWWLVLTASLSMFCILLFLIQRPGQHYLPAFKRAADI